MHTHHCCLNRDFIWLCVLRTSRLPRPLPRIPHIAAQGHVQIRRPQQSTQIRISCASLLGVYKTLPRPDVFAELLFTTVGDIPQSQSLAKDLIFLLCSKEFSSVIFGAFTAALHSWPPPLSPTAPACSRDPPGFQLRGALGVRPTASLPSIILHIQSEKMHCKGQLWHKSAILWLWGSAILQTRD